MDDFDFDTDRVPYATIHGKSEHGFGHLITSLVLPDLRHQGFLDKVYLELHSQCSSNDRDSPAEPFYAVDLYASAAAARGMNRRNCVRAAKAMGRIDLAIEKLNQRVGGPAVLLEDKIFRHLLAAKVEHVFVAHRINQPGSILKYERFRIKQGIIDSGLRSYVMNLKHKLLDSVGAKAA